MAIWGGGEGGITALLATDGTTYRPFKENASSRMEMLGSGHLRKREVLGLAAVYPWNGWWLIGKEEGRTLPRRFTEGVSPSSM